MQYVKVMFNKELKQIHTRDKIWDSQPLTADDKASYEVKLMKSSMKSTTEDE
jgi:hypothetical protein